MVGVEGQRRKLIGLREEGSSSDGFRRGFGRGVSRGLEEQGALATSAGERRWRALLERGHGYNGGSCVPVKLETNRWKYRTHEHQRREGSLTVLCLIEDMAGDGLSTCTGDGAGGGNGRRCS